MRPRSALLYLVGLSVGLACGSPAVTPVNVTAPAKTPAATTSDTPRPKPSAADAGSAAAAFASSEIARLVAELEDARDESRQSAALSKLRELCDPQAADALARFVASPTAAKAARPKMLAAMALAELHDARAVDWLLWRIELDPTKVERKDDGMSLGNADDSERIAAARVLAEVLVRHPELRDALRPRVESAVFAWIAQRPQPHMNALRVLAVVGSPRGVTRMRAWADPRTPLPTPGTAAFPADFATAQVALRMLGASQRGASAPDEQAWKLLAKQLERRPPGVDGRLEAALTGGAAVRTMALRALAVGAIHGFAEWGDGRAFPLFIRYIEEPRNNEQAKGEAGMLLPWVATDAQLRTLVAKVPSSPPLVQSCYLTALARAAMPGLDASLLPLLDPKGSDELQGLAAFAIGATGVDADVVPKLVTRLDADATRLPAAIALFFGADEQTAASAVARLNEGERDALAVRITQAPFDDYRIVASGHLARWARNANACEAPSLRKALATVLRSHTLASGPRTLSAHQLRGRLRDDLAGDDPPRAADARVLLDLLNNPP